jgi:hypothetical protein
VIVGAECPSASVVLTCDGHAGRLFDVLQALARQSLPPERVEIVLALPRAQHAEATALAGRAGVSSRVRLAEVRGGTPEALNSALDLVREAVVLFLDERLVPDSSLLARHVRAHAERPGDIAVLGYSPPTPSSGSPLWDQRQRAEEEDFFRRLRQAAHQWSFVDFRSGNASLPRRCLGGVGGFDTRLSDRRADWELALRLLKRGVKFVHDADARALHHLDGSLDDALCRRRIEAGDDLLITAKHPSAGGLLPLSRVALARGAWRSVLLRSWPAEVTVEVGLALLSLYESLNLRRQWHDLVDRLMEWSYAVGLAQSAGSSPRVAPPRDMREEPASAVLSLALDHQELCGGAAGVGPTELALTWSGSPVHVLRAVEPEEQWDWERIYQRIVASAPASLRRALLIGLLGPVDQYTGEGAKRGRHVPASQPRAVRATGRES